MLVVSVDDKEEVSLEEGNYTNATIQTIQINNYVLRQSAYFFSDKQFITTTDSQMEVSVSVICGEHTVTHDSSPLHTPTSLNLE